MKLPGAHRLVRTRPDKVVIYWHAFRGGPKIGQFTGATRALAEAAETLGAGKLAEAYGAARSTEPPKDIVAGLITAYKADAADGFQSLSASTQAAWGPWLDTIRDYFGTLPVSGLKAKGIRGQIIKWRNSYAATPRKADMGLQVLRRVLNWSVDHELADVNPALKIADLYDADRSAEIVEPLEMAHVLAQVSAPMQRWVRLAALTGLRRGDLRRLRWSHINATSIEMDTAKSRRKGKTAGKKRIIVPLLPAAQIVLEECRAAERERCANLRARKLTPIPSPFVMTTRAGKQWSKDGPTGMWVKACLTASPPIEKHLHDLRGNFATHIMTADPTMSDDQIGDILGWEGDDVAKIRRRYVDRDKIALALVERLTKNGK